MTDLEFPDNTATCLTCFMLDLTAGSVMVAILALSVTNSRVIIVAVSVAVDIRFPIYAHLLSKYSKKTKRQLSRKAQVCLLQMASIISTGFEGYTTPSRRVKVNGHLHGLILRRLLKGCVRCRSLSIVKAC